MYVVSFPQGPIKQQPCSSCHTQQQSPESFSVLLLLDYISAKR